MIFHPPPLNASSDDPNEPYYDPADRARSAVISLVIALAVSAGLVLQSGFDWFVLRDDAYTKMEADISDLTATVLSVGTVIALLIAAIFFIRWLRRVTENLRPLTEGRLSYGAGWATGGWFVPVLSLWRPKQVVNQAWRLTESAPEGTRRSTRDTSTGVAGFVTLWWLLWVVTVIVGRIVAGLPTSTIDEIRVSDYWYLGSGVLDIVVGLLAINVVRTLTVRQRRRAEEVGLTSPLLAPTASAVTAHA